MRDPEDEDEKRNEDVKDEDGIEQTEMKCTHSESLQQTDKQTQRERDKERDKSETERGEERGEGESDRTETDLCLLADPVYSHRHHPPLLLHYQSSG